MVRWSIMYLIRCIFGLCFRSECILVGFIVHNARLCNRTSWIIIRIWIICQIFIIHNIADILQSSWNFFLCFLFINKLRFSTLHIFVARCSFVSIRLFRWSFWTVSGSEKIKIIWTLILWRFTWSSKYDTFVTRKFPRHCIILTCFDHNILFITLKSWTSNVSKFCEKCLLPTPTNIQTQSQK